MERRSLAVGTNRGSATGDGTDRGPCRLADVLVTAGDSSYGYALLADDGPSARSWSQLSDRTVLESWWWTQTFGSM